MLFGLPASTSVLWWVGLLLTQRSHQSGGGHDSRMLLLVAAVPALIALGWSLFLDAPVAFRLKRFSMIAVFTVIALALGALIILGIDVANCPPGAYECPI
jgi:hypothetical protein